MTAIALALLFIGFTLDPHKSVGNLFLAKVFAVLTLIALLKEILQP